LDVLHAGPAALNDPHALYAAAYRARLGKEQTVIEAWTHALELGADLPTLPLYLADDLAVPVELNDTYREACEGLRI
jgi:hypothetical protein